MFVLKAPLPGVNSPDLGFMLTEARGNVVSDLAVIGCSNVKLTSNNKASVVLHLCRSGGNGGGGGRVIWLFSAAHGCAFINCNWRVTIDSCTIRHI